MSCRDICRRKINRNVISCRDICLEKKYKRHRYLPENIKHLRQWQPALLQSVSLQLFHGLTPRSPVSTGSQSGSAAPVQPAPSPQTMGESANPTGHVKSTYQTASNVPVRLASTAGGAHSRDKRRRPLSAPGVAPDARGSGPSGTGSRSNSYQSYVCRSRRSAAESGAP